MSVDILGTNCNQSRSTVQCCFTSTETVRLIRTAQYGQLDFHTAPELCVGEVSKVNMVLNVHGNHKAP